MARLVCNYAGFEPSCVALHGNLSAQFNYVSFLCTLSEQKTTFVDSIEIFLVL